MRKNKIFHFVVGLLAVILIFGTTACGTRGKAPEFKPGSNNALTLSPTDYAARENWMSFGGDKSKNVDVFVVYPTVTMSTEKADVPYVRLGSGLMRAKVAAWLESQVKGVLAESANIYAPLYRQLNGAMLADLNSEQFSSYTSAVPREDIFAAFDYYLTHVNKGERPFILFGHSQGAKLVIELATTFLGNTAHYRHNKNHIATYAIGCSVDAGQVATNPNLRFSESRNDTGVIVSWNTTAPSEIASGAYARFGTWLPGALMTNPLTWETGETLAHASVNKGAQLAQPDGTYATVAGYANALVDKEHRVLVTTTVDETNYQKILPNISKFHQYDIQFYHNSVQQNVKDRIASFMAQ